MKEKLKVRLRDAVIACKAALGWFRAGTAQAKSAFTAAERMKSFGLGALVAIVGILVGMSAPSAQAQNALHAVTGASVGQSASASWVTANFVRKGPVISADATANNIVGSTTTAKIPLVVQQRTGASVDAVSFYAAGQTRFKVDTNGNTVLNGGLALRRIATSAASVTIANGQCGFHAITPSAAFTANLPAIATLPTGGSFLVLKNVAGTGATRNLTIDPSGAETIDGAATLVLSAAYWYAILFGDSTGWYVVATSG